MWLWFKRKAKLKISSAKQTSLFSNGHLAVVTTLSYEHCQESKKIESSTSIQRVAFEAAMDVIRKSTFEDGEIRLKGQSSASTEEYRNSESE